MAAEARSIGKTVAHATHNTCCPQVVETRENTRAARKKLSELHRRIVMEKMILYMV